MEHDESSPIEQAAPRALITIRLEVSGAVNVTFPQDPILAYGLLEQARATLDRHFAALNAPRVIPVNGNPSIKVRGLCG